MTPADWIALAAVCVPCAGAVTMSALKLTITLTKMNDRIDNHEQRLTKGGL